MHCESEDLGLMTHHTILEEDDCNDCCKSNPKKAVQQGQDDLYYIVRIQRQLAPLVRQRSSAVARNGAMQDTLRWGGGGQLVNVN